MQNTRFQGHYPACINYYKGEQCNIEIIIMPFIHAQIKNDSRSGGPASDQDGFDQIFLFQNSYPGYTHVICHCSRGNWSLIITPLYYPCDHYGTSFYIKFLNVWMPENFAVIYMNLKFKQRGQTLRYSTQKMQIV